MRKRWMTATAAALLAAGMICGCSNPQKAGVKALEEGNYEEAETQFTELTEESGKDGAEGYRGLGMVYYETEEYQKALEAFETAAESGIQPDVQMYNLMAVCAMQTEQYGTALEYIRSGLAVADSASAGSYAVSARRTGRVQSRRSQNIWKRTRMMKPLRKRRNSWRHVRRIKNV